MEAWVLYRAMKLLPTAAEIKKRASSREVVLILT